MLKIVILLILIIPISISNIIKMDDEQLQQFLEKIKQLESSGGTNTDHEVLQNGIHKGQSAYGSYGLMPNTVQELVNRARMSGQMPDQYKDLNNKNPDQIKQVLDLHPELQDRLAGDLGRRLLDKTGGDEDKAAYGWKMGHNLPSDSITPEKLDKNEYIKRFRSLKRGLINAK